MVRRKEDQPRVAPIKGPAVKGAQLVPLVAAPAATKRWAFGASRVADDWGIALAVFALLAGAVWVVYGRGIHAPFIFDDRTAVVQNPSIVKFWPLLGESGSGGPLTPLKDTVTAGRPVVNFSFAVNYYFGRRNTTGYHLTNMAAHLLSALLLWAIARRALRLAYFGGRFDRAAGPLSVMVALLWAVHPLQTEAVEYVSQRTELMMALFYLATLYASLRYWAAPAAATRAAWIILATVACALGMACKEVMVTAPVIVLLFERTFVAGSVRRALRDSWPLYLGLFSGWLWLFALNVGGPRSASAGFSLGISAPVWWLTQAKVLLLYLKLVVWPWPLVIHYEIPYLDTPASAWPWGLPTTGLVVAALCLLWRNSAVGFLGAATLLILAPTLLTPIPTEIAAERRMYLPLAALAALAVVGGHALLHWGTKLATSNSSRRSPDWPRIMITVTAAAALTVVLGSVSIRRVSAYRDLVTFWQDAALHQPDNAVVLVHLGAALTGAGRAADAIEVLRRADRLQVDSAAQGIRRQVGAALIHKQLGAALASAGRSQEAIEHLQAAAKLDPNARGLDHVLGITLLSIGRAEEALEHLSRAAKLNPDEAEVRDNLGVALGTANRIEEAITELELAVSLDPNLLSAQANLAFAYTKAGRSADAIAAAEKAAVQARAQGKLDMAANLDDWLHGYRKEHPAP